MGTPYIGEIRIFGGNFSPAGWAFCNGQLLPIDENSALFSLIGTTYGGNGVTTFALPDLRGRLTMNQGQGSGLSNRVMGEASGAVSVALTTNQIPGHSHAANGSSVVSTPSGQPTNNVVGTVGGRGGVFYNSAPSALTPMTGLNATGGSQPHENRQPYLGISFIIALFGIYPSRN